MTSFPDEYIIESTAISPSGIFLFESHLLFLNMMRDGKSQRVNALHLEFLIKKTWQSFDYYKFQGFWEVWKLKATIYMGCLGDQRYQIFMGIYRLYCLLSIEALIAHEILWVSQIQK